MKHRTHDCGTLRNKDVGSKVILSGWVHRRRDHGGLIFIDLRDKFGLTQIVFDPKISEKAHKLAEELRAEYVIRIEGKVIPRAEGMANPKMDTGEIEITVSALDLLSKAKTPPFSICDEEINVYEELRLKYRYLDIRRGNIAKKLETRHLAMQAVRKYLSEKQFIEITTPLLGKSTPEGARDYVVPSRLFPGQFYALPQSPQLFKQILMISGMDRYFQIAACLRDEDLRANRQPEFTQIDLEMSFAEPEELFPIIEELLQAIFRECKRAEIPAAFERMPYHECIDRYGTDKPDLRFGMPLINLNDLAERSSFTVFKEQITSGGIVKGLCVKNGSSISRKEIDGYTEFVSQFGIRGLAWIKQGADGELSSSIVKFFPEDVQKELIERMEMRPSDLIFMIADSKDKTHQALDHLRRKIAADRNLVNPAEYKFLWVTDFPLFSWNHDKGQIESEHHPFTQPHAEDIHLIDTDPLNVRSSSYDLVLNGHEIASGSQRIHNEEMQQKIFNSLKINPEDLQERFGFFLEALNYGTPPHLGIALGFDRIIMVLTGTENIRDVIAFPKSSKANDLMMQAPSPISKEQLHELNIQIEDLQTVFGRKKASSNS